jgi:hypothetical protein
MAQCPLQSVVLLFSLLSARPRSRNRLILISILMVDDIHMPVKFRPFYLAFLGNQAFTLINRQLLKDGHA